MKIAPDCRHAECGEAFKSMSESDDLVQLECHLCGAGCSFRKSAEPDRYRLCQAFMEKQSEKIRLAHEKEVARKAQLAEAKTADDRALEKAVDSAKKAPVEETTK